MRKRFWVKPALGALGCVAVAAFLGLWAFTYRALEPAVVALVFAVGAWLAAGQAWRRWLGVHVERSAFERLNLPSGWHAHHGASSPAGGDIDILITAPDDRRFAVEVKSKTNVATRRTWGGFGPRILCDGRGRKVARDDLAQAMANAKAVSAMPVLWYPRAGDGATARVEGVCVVFGSPRKLRRAVGAGGWFW